MQRYCIIGAGACGLAVAKTFAERGIPFDCFEALADIGGIWNPDSPHAVYGSTYLNSSKRLSRYPDFHFPEEWSHYVSRAQAQDYLRAYAREFGLYQRISFNKRVTSAVRGEQGWRVTLEGEASPRLYAGLVVANGHHWEKFTPTYPGTFTGEMLHSHDVKSKEQLRGKRVLVVGAGNSAVDILSDAALDGARAVHSMRRSYYFFPKMVLGKPADTFIDMTSKWPLPRRVMRLFYRLGLIILVGRHKRYGLPAPDHNLFEAHPTACTTYLDHIVHGRIVTKPAIEKLDGEDRALRRRQRGGGRSPRLGDRLSAELPVHGPVLHSQQRRQLQALHPYLPSPVRRSVRGGPVRAGRRRRMADRRLPGAADRMLHRGVRQRSEARRLVPRAESERHARYRPRHTLAGHAVAPLRDPALPLPHVYAAPHQEVRRLRPTCRRGRRAAW